MMAEGNNNENARPCVYRAITDDLCRLARFGWSFFVEWWGIVVLFVRYIYF